MQIGEEVKPQTVEVLTSDIIEPAPAIEQVPENVNLEVTDT